ncbi:helix-turn-helix transcriptional regulator [Paenibacillus xylaniclasticus]|uniref:helix-turn-helix transcriptional regulator n=1 Tax=Paenibacillus xylaniclasticus TaxID=588083 RepID=UPI000FDB4AE7|nr:MULTISPECIES: hypothetical protein [Paenibacillus]GFN32067.1 hypothetical protein PCURB6_23270 [Paenibacillus curdlanolyticus]
MENLVKAIEVCTKFSISNRTLCRWKNEGLPSVQLSYNMVRYNLEAVEKWILEVKVKSARADVE